jgi:hypothetical protein
LLIGELLVPCTPQTAGREKSGTITAARSQILELLDDDLTTRLSSLSNGTSVVISKRTTAYTLKRGHSTRPP